MRTLALLMLIACGGGETPAADGDGTETEAPAPDAGGDADAKPDEAFAAPTELEAGMDICLGPVDCVPVQLACSCDDAAWVAVNKSRVDDAKGKYAQKGCDAPAECEAPATECAGGCKIKQ